jgi:hypothetical protein
MVYCVKCSTEVKGDENSGFAVISSFVDVVEREEECSFSAVVRSISRLTRALEAGGSGGSCPPTFDKGGYATPTLPNVSETIWSI